LRFFQEKNRTRSIKNGFDAKKRIINKQEPKLLKLAQEKDKIQYCCTDSQLPKLKSVIK